MPYTPRHPGAVVPEAEFQAALGHLKTKYGVPGAVLNAVLGHGALGPTTAGQRTRKDIAETIKAWQRTLPKAA